MYVNDGCGGPLIGTPIAGFSWSQGERGRFREAVGGLTSFVAAVDRSNNCQEPLGSFNFGH
jgi:hypothetical protein